MPQTDASALEAQLARYSGTRFHLLIRDQGLREQVGVILALLRFEHVTVLPTTGSYLDNVRRLAGALIRDEGIFLVNPPLALFGDDGKVKVRKELKDFFSDLSLVLAKTRRETMRYVSKCVPIFADIQLTQKRERILTSLAHYGVSGAFILKPQDSLEGLSPSFYKIRLKEMVMERLEEVRDYLAEYLTHIDGALDDLIQKKEERALSERKAEADKWMEQGTMARSRGDWEKAIECFKRTIDLLPDNPDAYLESGRIYVHIRKYAKALFRFNQAEEVATTAPEPNKEIGNVRVLQVKERVEQGESPNSPAILALLEEAMEHFQTALRKAEKIKPLHDDEKIQARSMEAVTRIAGEMLKLDVKSFLGKRHPMVKQLGQLAHEAFSKVSGADSEALSSQHLIFLGLAAMDERRFEEAERYLFKAAREPESFSEACDEITILGIHVRKVEGAPPAIELYKRLLSVNPPNLAAVFFNLAVAYGTEKNILESAGAIVQALYVDLSLAENRMFYNNPILNGILDLVVRLFAAINQRMNVIHVPEVMKKAIDLQERLETLILDQDDKHAFRLLRNVIQVMPEFFHREHVAASRLILRYATAKKDACLQSSKPEVVVFGKYMEDLIKQSRELKFSKRLVAYANFKAQVLRLLRQGKDEAEAANIMTKAVVCHPEYVERPEFYANPKLLVLVQEIYAKLARVDRATIAAYSLD